MRVQLSDYCDFDCATAFGIGANRNSFEKKCRKDRTEAKQENKGWQAEKAQTAFNKYVRLRDYALPCISCGRHHQGQYHGGHYRSVGAAPHLRFNEDNCAKQCSPCNNHKSGNAVEYRINLIKKIGVERVEALESDNTPRQYRIEDYKAIRTKYNLKSKALEREIDHEHG